MLEELGQSFDRISVDVDDAARALAHAERLTLRLCRSRPQISAVLVRHYMQIMDSDSGVARRLLRDIQAGMASGRLHGRGSAAGPRGDLRGGAGHPADGADGSALVDDAACDRLVEQLLRMLGVSAPEAHELAHAPLPSTEFPEPR